MEDAEIARRAVELLGAEAERIERLSGGLSRVHRLVLADGRRAVVKTGGASRTEAAMLAAMAAAGVPCPAVLAVDDAMLAITELPADGRLSGEAWPRLGRAVGRLHASGGPSYGREPSYGWEEDHAFGRAAIPNAPALDWVAFWAERRLLAWPGAVPAVASRLEGLASRLGEHIPRAPRPVLLHGDLWTGNVLVSRAGAVALIDPACYRGHSEVDLAMLSLFGAPGSGFAEAYGRSEAGAAERLAVYQLWPALVHLRLFGGGYARLVDGLLRRLGH